MTRSPQPTDDLLERGMRVEADLDPDTLSEVSRMVGMGLFGSASEFCFVAVTTYLDLVDAAPLHAVLEAEMPRPSRSGVSAEALLPGHMAIRVAHLVASGHHASPEAFLSYAASAYVHLRGDPDLMEALDAATVQAALDRPFMPLRHAVAAFTNRFRRLPPLSASEAMAAMSGAANAA